MSAVRPATLADLAFQVAAAGRGRRLVAGKRGNEWSWWTAEEWLTAIHHVAIALERRGVVKGDRIALLSANCPEWHLVDFACHFLGAALVPIYITLPADQVAYILEDSASRFIFYRDREQAETVRGARKLLGKPIEGVHLTLDTAGTSDLAFETWRGDGAAAAPQHPIAG